jgi:hypothetical protein
VPIVLKSGSLNLLESSGPVKACNGSALPLPYAKLNSSIVGKGAELFKTNNVSYTLEAFSSNYILVFRLVTKFRTLDRILLFSTVLSPSTTTLEGREIVDAPGKDDNASMPEQGKRPNPWMMMTSMMMMCCFVSSTQKPEHLYITKALP